MAPGPPLLPIQLLSLLLLLVLLQTSANTAANATRPTPTKSHSVPSRGHLPIQNPPSSLSIQTPISSLSIVFPISNQSPSLLSASPSPSPSTLDPKQLMALQSLDIPTSKDPCSPSPLHNATHCDASKPFRHLLSLRLANCSDDVQLSITALKSLSTLTTLEFINCPTTSPVHFPSDLALNLRSFSCINSLKKLTGVWLSRFQNLTDLTVSGVTVNASGPAIILGAMKKLKSVTISGANLTGFLPKHLYSNLTHIDLSGNRLKGKISSSLSLLENLHLLNLSSNNLTGDIPTSIGDLLSLQNLSLASNSLSGSIPESIAAIPALIHLDLASNQLNGTIPKFIADMKHLKYLNLEKNNFNGVLPFNASFIKRLGVFRIGGNTNLCYNHSTLPPKVKLGIAPCDRHGLPLSPPPAKDPSSDGGESTNDDYSIEDEYSGKKPKHKGPSSVILAVIIGLAAVLILIILLVLISKCCK